jgi:hypothetical protein
MVVGRSLKNLKNAGEIFRRNANAIVAEEKAYEPVPGLGGNVDLWFHPGVTNLAALPSRLAMHCVSADSLASTAGKFRQISFQRLGECIEERPS